MSEVYDWAREDELRNDAFARGWDARFAGVAREPWHTHRPVVWMMGWDAADELSYQPRPAETRCSPYSRMGFRVRRGTCENRWQRLPAWKTALQLHGTCAAPPEPHFCCSHAAS